MGLIPTTPLELAGQMMEPSVSVPTATAHRSAETATAEPELEPHGLRSSAYGLRHCPPRALHPLVARVERKFAHSDRFVLPSTRAPASRSRRTTNASRWGRAPTSASEPAVVFIRSAVSMLSFTRTGMPCRGPRAPLERRSASSASATVRASGAISITDRSSGPARSRSSIRSRYASASVRAVSRPEAIRSCSSTIDASLGGDASGGAHERRVRPATRGGRGRERYPRRGPCEVWRASACS